MEKNIFDIYFLLLISNKEVMASSLPLRSNFLDLPRAQGSTVGTFHTKGWTKVFSGQISTFWSQNNVFYNSARLQAIFR
jgi:hypothetical protein